MVASRAKIKRPRAPAGAVRSIVRTRSRNASISAREDVSAGVPFPTGTGVRSSGDFAMPSGPLLRMPFGLHRIRSGPGSYKVAVVTLRRNGVDGRVAFGRGSLHLSPLAGRGSSCGVVAARGLVLWHSSASVRQAERDVLARVAAAADGHNDVLLAVHHVGHRIAALRCRHEHGANLLAARLVVGPQHG